MALADLNFADILDWARVAAASYDDELKLRDAYGSSVWTKTLRNGVRVLVVRDTARGCQWLSVRGSDAFTAIRDDAELVQERDAKLGLFFHAGFHRDALALYDDTCARLVRDLPVRVTGHSLGGALASILQAWLRHDGFQLDTTITFGQPKTTNEEGAISLRTHPLLRVINDEDVVPMIPPLTLRSSQRGPYRHFGRELQLGPVAPLYQLYTEHDAETPAVTGFWCNLCHKPPRDHHIALYLAKIDTFRTSLTDRHQPTSTLPPPGDAKICAKCGKTAH